RKSRANAKCRVGLRPECQTRGRVIRQRATINRVVEIVGDPREGVKAVDNDRDAVGIEQNAQAVHLMLSLISAVNFASEQTLWIGGANPAAYPVSVRVKCGIVKPLENPRRFGKGVNLRREVLAESSRDPVVGTIERGRKRITDRQITRMIILNMEYSPGQRGEGSLFEILQN